MYSVYMITNKINGKRYVGVSIDPYRRFKEHCRYAGVRKSPMYDDMDLYGMDNFLFEVLEHGVSEAEHLDKERYYIQKYNTYSSELGYNRNKGGSSVVHHTEETKRKISQSLKGHVFPQSRNEKIRKAMLGREYKEEWKKNLSKSRVGRFAGQNNPFYGKTHTTETIQHFRQVHSRRPVYQLDDDFNILREFMSCLDAARWLELNGFCKKSSTASGRLYMICNTGKINSTAYGFHWKYKEGQSTNCRAEDELQLEARDSVSGSKCGDDIVSAGSNTG